MTATNGLILSFVWHGAAAIRMIVGSTLGSNLFLPVYFIVNMKHGLIWRLMSSALGETLFLRAFNFFFE